MHNRWWIQSSLSWVPKIQADYIITAGGMRAFLCLETRWLSIQNHLIRINHVTSSRQINFWGKQAGASEAVLAREFHLPNYSCIENLEFAQKCDMVLTYPPFRNDLFFKLLHNFIRQKNLWRKPRSWSSLAEQEIPIPIIQSMKTNMEPISSQIMTWIWWPSVWVGRTWLWSLGNSMVSFCRVALSRYRVLCQRPVIWFKMEHLHRIKPICLMKIRKLHPTIRGLDTGFYDYEPDRVNNK